MVSISDMVAGMGRMLFSIYQISSTYHSTIGCNMKIIHTRGKVDIYVVTSILS